MHAPPTDTAQRAKLGLKMKKILEAKAKERQREAGKEHGRGQERKVPVNSPEPIPKNKTEGESREQAAQEVGISAQTLSRYEKIQEEADEEIKEKVDRGELSINKAYTGLKQPTKEGAIELHEQVALPRS